MKKHNILLAIAALALSLLSCEKETFKTAPASPEAQSVSQPTTEQLSLPLVLFQYSYTNLETGEEIGWIIDRSGYVRTYSASHTPGTVPSSDNEAWQEAEVFELHARSTEMIASLEDEEVLSFARKALSLHRDRLSQTERDEEATWVAGLYAFTQARKTSGYGPSSHESGCNAGVDYSNPGLSETKINRLIISLSGQVNRYETSTSATDLQQWLLGLNDGL